jgi:hypothetical protein
LERFGDVEVTRGLYSVDVLSAGSNYSIGEILTIKGTQIGGSSPAEDCLITVTDVSFAGAILDYTVSGGRLSVTDRFAVREISVYCYEY